MFTGIVTHCGTVREISGDTARRLVIATGMPLADVVLGASIACSGICLTVVDKDTDAFAVEASPETLAKTTLGAWQAGTVVNLERALRLGDELGGHLVTGHVDEIGTLLERTGARVTPYNRQFPARGAVIRIVWPRSAIEAPEGWAEA